MTRLRVQGLSTPSVDAVSLDIAAGECVTVHGPSGCGKTLLLRAIADLDPNTGEVWLDEQPRDGFSPPDWRRRVTYLAAESSWWGRTVGEHAIDWCRDHLVELGFADDVLDWEVQRLSSGERQRLALARALNRKPAVLLLDEPSANLDNRNTLILERLVRQWQADSGAAALWVSHDPAQRARVAARHLQFVDRQLVDTTDD